VNLLAVSINARVWHSLSISLIICSLAGTFNVHCNLSPNHARICSRFLGKKFAWICSMIISCQLCIFLFTRWVSATTKVHFHSIHQLITQSRFQPKLRPEIYLVPGASQRCRYPVRAI
jgi:hypothetical protein